MISFLVKKHLLIAVVIFVPLAIAPLGIGITLAESVPRAILWSGILAALVLYFEVRRARLWPLFDNLRLSRARLYSALIGAHVLLFILLKVWMA